MGMNEGNRHNSRGAAIAAAGAAVGVGRGFFTAASRPVACLLLNFALRLDRCAPVAMAMAPLVLLLLNQWVCWGAYHNGFKCVKREGVDKSR